MKSPIVTKIILGLCAILIIIPGILSLTSPEYFTGRNGEDIGGRISLLNDYRATGTLMVGAGLMMQIGIFRSRMIITSLFFAVVAHLGLGLGRWVSLAMDGMPADTLFKATVVETVLGLVAFFMLYRTLREPQDVDRQRVNA